MYDSMDLLLITPPFLQLNTPYPAVPMLARHLRGRGFTVAQRDFSLETALAVFTPEVVKRAVATAKKKAKASQDESLAFFVEHGEEYLSTISQVVSFLQGANPELAWRIVRGDFLPEGPFFRDLDPNGEDSAEEFLGECFGFAGRTEQARYMASLYMDDLAAFIAASLDEEFSFGRYAEGLCVSLPTMEPLQERLKRKTFIDEIVENLTIAALQETSPKYVGISVPFPGTLLEAFRIAETVRRVSPQTKLILGGGFVNSEMREVEDTRIFDYFDYISFDDGCLKLEAILRGGVPSGLVRSIDSTELEPALLMPDYSGVDLDKYLSIMETPNPMGSMWTNGVWLKMQLAHGCYWHRCAFCDVSLDYIHCYRAAKASEIVDGMETLIRETGRRNFHFVDEAIPPALLRAMSEEILRRNLSVVWWGNIRFEKEFLKDGLAELMARAGCIAVTGGLECAQDRLLTLMNKGITVASAKAVLKGFAEAGIMVHAYLMYGFPTETETEVKSALNVVRECFAEGWLVSAFWHRFALTVHSPMMANPEKYGIQVPPQKTSAPRFCVNECHFVEPSAPDWDRIGRILSTAVYNYMRGLGTDLPVKEWFKAGR